MFQFEFMKKAFFVGVLLSILIPSVGVVMVNRKQSLISDALSHISLAGVTIGLVLKINPIVSAVLSCLIASFVIEFMKKIFPKNRDISIAMIMSLGVGLAAIFSDYLKGASNIESFLFGSIVAITDFEVILVMLIFIIVIFFYIKMYRALLYLSFDEVGARLVGIKVPLNNFIFTLLISLTISISARTVGVLMVSSLMVIPVACSLKVSRSYFKTIINSIIFAIFFTITGLTLSFYEGIKPGGAMVLTGIATFIILVIVQKIKKAIKF